jgi:hypothetical protein
MPPGLCPLKAGIKPILLLDGQKLQAEPVKSNRSWRAQLQKKGTQWSIMPSNSGIAGSVLGTELKLPLNEQLRNAMTQAGQSSSSVMIPSSYSVFLTKRHGLQGPIDDAFLDSFIFVRPTGKAANEAVGAWVKAELQRAITQWRALFRGEAIVKNDDEITAADIAHSHLILWGDAMSNKLLARIANKLPIQWKTNQIQVGAQTYSSAQHIPLLIYPNPLRPNRYIVLNSGFTFREADHVSNARQNPKLPDWAIVDITTPPSPRSVGKVVNAGFFGERWELK